MLRLSDSGEQGRDSQEHENSAQQDTQGEVVVETPNGEEVVLWM